MDQVLMEQHQSFEHKLNNIHQTNNILDELQKKMNMYFNKTTPQRNSNTIANTRFAVDEQNEPISKNEQGFRRSTNGYINLQQKHKTTDFQFMGNHGYDNKKQLQFKFYNNNNKQKPDAGSNKNTQQDPQFNYLKNSKQRQARQKQRLSQTTVQKQSLNNDRNNQNRNSSNPNSRSRKNQQFILIGKSKRVSQQKQSQKRFPEGSLRQSLEADASLKIHEQQKQKYQLNRNQNYLRQEEDNHNHTNLQNQLARRQKQNNPIAANFSKSKSKNSLIHEMQTIQLLMKQRLEVKQRNIKRIQQQIMTENQQRVYLYKINVRLNEELKLLQQQGNFIEQENSKNNQWNIRKLEDDIERLKRQIARKKVQRKQLRKEEQTLKDGYQIVVNNKKNILRKDIENYMSKQNKQKENTQMLKGLIKQLDKLKGVVEQKIKSSIVSASKPTNPQPSRRKIIKSFKN